jgi:hypothetical protein
VTLKDEPLTAAGESVPVKIGIKLDQIVDINQRAENFSAVVTVPGPPIAILNLPTSQTQENRGFGCTRGNRY